MSDLHPIILELRSRFPVPLPAGFVLPREDVERLRQRLWSVRSLVERDLVVIQLADLSDQIKTGAGARLAKQLLKLAGIVAVQQDRVVKEEARSFKHDMLVGRQRNFAMLMAVPS